MIIIEDTRQQRGKHDKKNSHMKKLGAEIIRFKLPVGDYVKADENILGLINQKRIKANDLLPYISIAIDTKKDLNEINGDVTIQHERFKRELIKARDNNVKLIILCEENGIESLEDVYFWSNQYNNGSNRCTTGPKLYSSLCTMRDRYGVDFVFCQKETAGKVIINILNGGEVS